MEERSLNIWTYKPWWCQPWSIVLTGMGGIAASWLLFERWWLTVVVAVPLGIWMIFFVGIYPRLMRSVLAAEPQELP